MMGRLLAWLRRSRTAHVSVAVLAVLVAVELVATTVVQRRLDAAFRQMIPQANVQVSLGGWPVVPALLADQLGRVNVRAQDISLSSRGRELRVTSVTAHARGVHHVTSGPTIEVGRIDGRVELSWQQLSAATGANLGLGSDHSVQVSAPVPVLGEHLDGRLSGQVQLDEDSQQLVVDDPVGSLDGVPVPPEVLSGLVGRMSSRFTLPTMQGFRWTDIQVTDAGVSLGFEGSDLAFAR